MWDAIGINIEGIKTEPEYAEIQTYQVRHNVLFNLYAFDALHSNLTHSPTLNLYNCDFKYFHDKQALIQVENNNYQEMAVYNASTI